MIGVTQNGEKIEKPERRYPPLGHLTPKEVGTVAVAMLKALDVKDGTIALAFGVTRDRIRTLRDRPLPDVFLDDQDDEDDYV